MSRKTIADHAADILRETNNPAVMWGDCGLLDLICTRAKMKCGDKHPNVRHQRVLNALEGSPLFTKTVVYLRHGRSGNQCGRLFTLIQ